MATRDVRLKRSAGRFRIHLEELSGNEPYNWSHSWDTQSPNINMYGHDWTCMPTVAFRSVHKVFVFREGYTRLNDDGTEDAGNICASNLEIPISNISDVRITKVGSRSQHALITFRIRNYVREEDFKDGASKGEDFELTPLLCYLQHINYEGGRELIQHVSIQVYDYADNHVFNEDAILAILRDEAGQ